VLLLMALALYSGLLHESAGPESVHEFLMSARDAA